MKCLVQTTPEVGPFIMVISRMIVNILVTSYYVKSSLTEVDTDMHYPARNVGGHGNLAGATKTGSDQDHDAVSPVLRAATVDHVPLIRTPFRREAPPCLGDDQDISIYLGSPHLELFKGIG